MISKAELSKKAKEWNIRFDIVEKDFCIGWLLKGVAEEPRFKKYLIFKGGTALRKCYFQDHRFSEDLDFTALNELARENLDSTFSNICKRVSDESGCEFQLLSFEQSREVPEEEAYEARISFRGPTQPQNVKPVIKVDLTFYEQVVLPPLSKTIIHPYSDAFQTKVLVYSLEEILAEKLRAILQQKGRIPRPRDFYDVWALLKIHYERMELKEIRETFLKKCRFKNVSFRSNEDFFDAVLLQKNKSAWESSIGRQVHALVSFDQVIQELKIKLQEALG